MRIFTGKSSTSTYHAWENMKQRCDNSNHPYFSYYGGRGICYTPSWSIFKNFLEDMGECPNGLTLERLNNEDNYYKENCKWATWAEQALNKRAPVISVRNKSGVQGVSLLKKYAIWKATITINSVNEVIYRGRDFFEACCARKSWENKNAKTR